MLKKPNQQQPQHNHNNHNNTPLAPPASAAGFVVCGSCDLSSSTEFWYKYACGCLRLSGILSIASSPTPRLRMLTLERRRLRTQEPIMKEKRTEGYLRGILLPGSLGSSIRTFSLKRHSNTSGDNSSMP